MSLRIDIHNIPIPNAKTLSGLRDDVVFFSSEATKKNRGWPSFSYFQEMSQSRENFKRKLYAIWIDVLRIEYHVHESTLFIISKKIDAVVQQACFNLGVTIKDEITKRDVHAIGTEIARSIIAVGSKPSYRLADNNDATQAKRLLFKFLIDEVPDIDSVAKEELIRALLWQKDVKLLAEAREGLQDTMQDCYNSLLGQQAQHAFGQQPLLPLESAIGNLLAIYPFLDPQEGELIFVPRKVGGVWHYVPYSVEKIQMTPKFFPSHMFAYGLRPLPHFANFPPILLFKGTTYPTDDGAFLSILSDLNPFASVGEYVFLMAKSRLQNWIDKNTEKAKAHVYGTSLGGSLTLQAAIAFSSKIEVVHAYSPPALWNRKIVEWEKILPINKPDVFVYCNEGDVIPHFGSKWGNGWKLIQVVSSKSYNPFLSHCRVFSAGDVIMLDRNMEKDHQAFSRRLLSTVQMVASLPIFCFLAIVFCAHTSVKKIANKITR